MDNEKNIRITREDVEHILNFYENIGDNDTYLKINNLDIYQQAFVHESYYQSVQNNINNSGPMVFDYIPMGSNQRLEFLGDNILKSGMAMYLYQRCENDREGFLTQTKIKIERTCTLHKFAKEIGFEKFLLLSSQIENQTFLEYNRGRNTQSYYEDAFEAFIGSISLDFGEKGFIYAYRFIKMIIENVIDFTEIIYKNDNYKDILQRYFQSKALDNPIYKTLKISDSISVDHVNKTFIRIITLNKDKLSVFDNNVKNKIINYNTMVANTFGEMDENYYVIGLGKGVKIINADQESAKECLVNLNISDF